MKPQSKYLKKLEREQKSFLSYLSTGFNVFQMGWNILNAPVNYSKSIRARQQYAQTARAGIEEASARLDLLNQSGSMELDQIAREHMAAQSLFETTAAGSLGSLSELSTQSILSELETSKELHSRALIQRQALEERGIKAEIQQMKYEEEIASRSWGTWFMQGLATGFESVAEQVMNVFIPDHLEDKYKKKKRK